MKGKEGKARTKTSACIGQVWVAYTNSGVPEEVNGRGEAEEAGGRA